MTVEDRALVFDKGDCGSKFYRIPGIATTFDGAIIAVADRRWDALKDLPARIDVVSRRSDDGGRTWSDYATLAAADSAGGYGDPAIGLDPQSGELVVVMTHGSGVWDLIDGCPPVIMTSRSSDGINWSAPKPINLDFPDNFISYFATSGAIHSTADGRMMFVLVARDNEKKYSQLKSYACLSDDGGRTWRLSDQPADADGDESKIVELADGTLLMSIRNRRKGLRKFSASHDGGRSWEQPWECEGLPDPACNGEIIRRGDRLLHTMPDSSTDRRDVSLFESGDNGRTWQKLGTLCPALSAYSTITELHDGSLGLLIEENASDGGFRIWFQRLKW